MPRICVTRALKNAKYIQLQAPHIIPAEEPAEGFASLVPLDILRRFHNLSEEDLVGYPDLQKLVAAARPPTPRAAPLDALFAGTIFFAQVTFDVGGPAPISVSAADMGTAVQFLTRASVPIAAYASQYGPNSLTVSQSVLQFSAKAPNASYNDSMLQGWVNNIASQNNLPSSSCVVVLNPQGVTNTDGNINTGTLGYHGKANIPYCFVNVFGQGLTIADAQDFYAWQLSHEVAEMTVDPNVDGNNPEVCDGCGPNCPPDWRNFFAGSNNAYVQTVDAFPPAFAFDFFINSIAQQSSVSQCPAPQSACAYAPPGQLIEYWYDGENWSLNNHGFPSATGVGSRPAIVAWNQAGVPIRMNTFYRGVNEHLIENWFDGTNWNVTDHGQPANTAVAGTPAMVAWNQPNVPVRINVFYTGANGNLIEYWFDGNNWNVNDHGQPANTSAGGTPAIVAWNQPGVPVRINMFYGGANGNLIEYWFDGNNWNVTDHGQPANTAVFGTAAMVAWNQPGVAVRLNVFYLGTNSHLIEYWFDGSKWNVNDHGQPSNTLAGATILGPDSIVAWNDANVPVRINMFYGGVNGDLIEYWFDGNNWNVTDHGQPAGAPVIGTPAAVAWNQPGVDVRMNVFYIGLNGHLIEYWWNGSAWNVNDHGQPANTFVGQSPVAVAWNEATVPVRLNVFYGS